jgi:GntR family transcriptional regulator, rspAB operon transcriptional repressor
MNNTVLNFDAPTPPRKGTRGGAGDHIYTVLREAIVSLELKPGQALDKQVLADQFGVSRAPIYDAFTRLQAEALVDVVPQRGTTVSLVKMSDARENMFLRRAIEVEAVRAITRNFNGDHLESLKQNLRYQRAAVETGDAIGFHRFDLEFHAVLFEALGFERVKAFAETARLGLDRVRRLLNSRRRQEFTLAEHQAIVDAIQECNANGAANAMGAHLDAVMKELETFAAANPELFADLQTKSDGHT